MDINLSYALSNEDLAGVLRTILLFLESINFQTTSTALQNECSSKGYLQITAAPAKIVVVHSPPVLEGMSHKGNQTDFPNEDDKLDELESSVYETTNRNYDSNYWKNIPIDFTSSQGFLSDTTNQEIATSGNECECAKPIEGTKESQNVSPNRKNKHLQHRRAPNTIESECPSKISAKKFSKNEGCKPWFKRLRKTHSNPSLKLNAKAKVDNKNCERQKASLVGYSSTELENCNDCQDLKKRFRQLQTEHRKLMGVTTELTTALQTHILGQSENLNSMLNNCKNIYPDLFNSVYSENCNNLQNILAKHTPPQEGETDISYISPKQIVQQNVEEMSKNSVNQANIVETLPGCVTTVEGSSVISDKQCRISQDKKSNILQGSPASSIRNSDNIRQSSILSNKSQHKDDISQGSLFSRQTIRNSDCIIRNVSPTRSNRNSNVSQSSTPSTKSIPGGCNVVQNLTSPNMCKCNRLEKTIPSRDNVSPIRSNRSSNVSQSSSPPTKTIPSRDNVSPIRSNRSSNVSQSSTTPTKNVPGGNNVSPARSNRSSNISQSSTPSTKTVPSGNNVVQNLQSSNMCKCSGLQSSPSPDKSFRKNDNALGTLSPLRVNKYSSNKSQNSPSPSTPTIRNSDCILVPPQTNNGTDKNGNEENEAAVQIEVRSVVGDGSYATTVLTPKFNRPQTSSIILVTTTNDEPQNSILVRQLSSKSLDESLLSLNVNPVCSGSTDQNINCNTPDTKYEGVTTVNTTQIPDVRNFQQQTSLSNVSNEELDQETPEIFVTTEHLEKIQGCKCKSSGESDYNSSPRGIYFDLDFRKLKKDMLNGDDSLKLGLIQALRWRITQSDSETRDQVISSYIRHDLLGLHSAPNSCGQSMTEIYYCPNKDTPHPLQEGMARLVNTFASLTLGRDYLCQDDDLVISLLVPLVIGTHYSKVKISSVTRDMLMATLQKLSIRNRQRIRMITAGLVEYLVTFLSTEHATITEYCMEYTTALLMNLCLHREARELLRSSATDVVSLLADLMNTKYRSCIPYVNGAMYSLLGDPFINKEAQRLNLAKLIDYHIKRSDGEMRSQLEFILQLHLQEGQNDCGCDPNVEPENEVDLLEPELDRSDSIKVQPAGEELLKNYRLLFPISGAQVNVPHLKCLCRPVTPRVHSGEKTTTDFEGAKIMQSGQVDNINNQNEATSQVQEKQKCTYCAKITAQPENPSAVDGRADTQFCTCRATPNVGNTSNNNSNNTSPISSKRGNSLSQTITGSKSEKPIKQASVSARTSRSNSPAMSYSEETKQFYHTPSAKTGIFEPQKQKKLHRVPPSFTRTIPVAQKVKPNCDNPFCPHPYSKRMPISPKENSSVANPPYGLDCPTGFTMCYREGYVNQMDNLDITDGPNAYCISCSNNNKRSRYRCNCYNAIKGYIDQTPKSNTTDDKNENNTSCQENTEKSFLLPGNICCTCHPSNNIYTRGTPHNCNDTTINRGNEVFVNFSYEELLKTVHPDHDHDCLIPGADCQCYDVVFQSRPKILRTPP